jgi:hypothetical protein
VLGAQASRNDGPGAAGAFGFEFFRLRHPASRFAGLLPAFRWKSFEPSIFWRAARAQASRNDGPCAAGASEVESD